MSDPAPRPSASLSYPAWQHLAAGRAAPLARPALVSPEDARYGDDDFLPPPAPLADFVLYMWRRRFPPRARVVVQPTMPDGCVDLLSIDGGPTYVMGPETVRMDHLIPGGTEIVGVRLRPGVGARLFGAALGELVDGGAFIRDLSDTPAFLRSTRHQLASASAYHRPLLDALLPRIAAAHPDDGVSFGVSWLSRHPAGTIDELCVRLGWSPREVRRRFTSALGFGPKVMQRVLRFQRVLYLAGRGAPSGTATLSELAVACGYADQAHMTRDFRALALTTPGELLGGVFDATLPPVFDSAACHATALRPV
jgi:AraC-like DNA-binding protein